MTEDLIERLKVAAKTKMTPEQVRAQKVSFIYGQMNGSITKERISSILDRQ